MEGIGGDAFGDYGGRISGANNFILVSQAQGVAEDTPSPPLGRVAFGNVACLQHTPPVAWVRW